MREILFRGKRVADGKWVEGWYFYDVLLDKHLIRENKSTYSTPEFYDRPVDKNTIGQYTGLKDKNGVKVFEGDSVRFEAMFAGEEDFEGTLVMLEGCWMIENEKDAILLWQECSPVEIING